MSSFHATYAMALNRLWPTKNNESATAETILLNNLIEEPAVPPGDNPRQSTKRLHSISVTALRPARILLAIICIALYADSLLSSYDRHNISAILAVR